jgi:hypothetical protein
MPSPAVITRSRAPPSPRRPIRVREVPTAGFGHEDALPWTDTLAGYCMDRLCPPFMGEDRPHVDKRLKLLEFPWRTMRAVLSTSKKARRADGLFNDRFTRLTQFVTLQRQILMVIQRLARPGFGATFDCLKIDQRCLTVSSGADHDVAHRIIPRFRG